MANSTSFNLSGLVNNPNFDFLHTLASSDDDSFSNYTESPYTQSIFSSTYVDIPTLTSKLTNHPSLSLMSLNIQSLSSKYSDLRDLIIELSTHNCCPDFICLQETWFIADPSLYPLPGFQPLLFTSRSTGRGGGGWHLH